MIDHAFSEKIRYWIDVLYAIEALDNMFKATVHRLEYIEDIKPAIYDMKAAISMELAESLKQAFWMDKEQFEYNHEPKFREQKEKFQEFFKTWGPVNMPVFSKEVSND
ncbi:MAG: hypothetical protein KatS3mg002_0398 [Candidatus Woesearchaeota archaeon]|nr:MAG: hypothetical protein KatS3mg002_0398 [Candidatus Woesearchaeota archaeon]